MGKMAKIVVVEGEDTFECNDFSELVKKYLGEDYYSLGKEEQKKRLEMKAFANCGLEGINIISDMNFSDNDLEESFVAYDEMSYFLSMAKFDKFVIAESNDANAFIKKDDNIVFNKDYVIVNKYAENLLRKHMNLVKGVERD